MSKRTWAVLAAVAVAGCMTSRVQAQQRPVPAPPGNNEQQDDRRNSDYLHYLHGAAHGLGPHASEEVPPPVVPETKAPSPEFRFNPSEFRTTTGVSEFTPVVREAGPLFRGGEGALAAAGGGLAAFFGAIGSLFGRGKKGPKE
jgi:hypothetical protein